MEKTIEVSGFPYLVTIQEAKNLFERYTGPETIVALEVKPNKDATSTAIVQFSDTACVETIENLATTDSLKFKSSLLKARESTYDIIKPQKKYDHEINEVILNFGCQISESNFSVLQSIKVLVKLENKLENMCFLLTYESVQYMLQLSCHNMRQIMMYMSGHDQTKHLVIELIHAPRIYEKLNGLDDHRYIKEGEEDGQWVRTTDFTTSFIGQSSGFCLQIPHNTVLPSFEGSFVKFGEREISLIFEECPPFPNDYTLVPILHPPSGYESTYPIIFKISSLVQTGCLPWPKLDADFFNLIDPEKYNLTDIEHALEKLSDLKYCCYDPVTWLHDQYTSYAMSTENPISPSISLGARLVYVRRVRVTPTKVYFSGPELNVSNRVLRQYINHIDNFLRVSFVDEDGDQMHSTTLSPPVAVWDKNKRNKIYDRIRSTLREGIEIGDKKFVFLAFSTSQVRNNSLWMFASNPELNADNIRSWMGDFRPIRNVAKYAARLGQSFGSSIETLSVGRDEIETIPDIEVIIDGTKYLFSDGIGKISKALAESVASRCVLKDIVPSAFQIRYGGYKGVVAIDPFSTKKLSLRPSMLKYESGHTQLDVLSWSKHQPCFLNRQIITLLSTLGVKDHVFEKKQKEAVDNLDATLDGSSISKEDNALDWMSPGENTNILKEILKWDKPNEEPFLSMILQKFRSFWLLDLRLKTRIFVAEARQMMGCLDETGILDYGQVFVQVCDAEKGSNSQKSDKYVPILGAVIVAKSPCLHPGDVRVLEAVWVSNLKHMFDCVVFPQRGTRPHPNECSGSDLDGDLYFVCWDTELIPPTQIDPMEYKPAPANNVDHDVTIEEVEKYFVNYSVKNNVGIISNAHLVFADKEPLKASSEPCIELAKLFSIAVDYPKTGIPATIPRHLRVKEFPDFMEKSDKPTYVSNGVIGKLFRQIKDIDSALPVSFTKDAAKNSYDPHMKVDGFEKYINEARECKEIYDSKLGKLMAYYGIETEAEIFSGCIMKMSKPFERKKDAEDVQTAMTALRSDTRSKLESGNEVENHIYAKLSAWYHVTYHPHFITRGSNYMSFPWCAPDILLKIKKNATKGSVQ